MIRLIFSILLSTTCAALVHTSGVLQQLSVCGGADPTKELKCPVGEVIYIVTASYGNFREGECSIPITEDCASDVTRYIENKCSGRETCKVTLADEQLMSSFGQHQQCKPVYDKSLKVKYSCKKYYNPIQDDCRQKPINVTSKTGFLSGLVTHRTDKGSNHCPWSFSVGPSKTLLLNLWDFGVYGYRKSSESNECRQYAFIKSMDFSGAICSGSQSRSVVYKRSDASVTIAMTYNEDRHCLIEYEVIDCLAYKPPEYVKVAEGYGSVLKVECLEGNKNVLVVRCENQTWTEVKRSNCSLPELTTSITSTTHMNNHSTILIVAVIALAAIISLVIIFVGLYCLQACPFQKNDKKSFCSGTPASQNLQTIGKYSAENVFVRPSQSMRELYPMLASHDHRVAAMQRDYATTLQMRQMAGCYPEQAGWCPAHGPYYLGSTNTIDRKYNTLKMKRNLSIPLSNCQMDHYSENKNTFISPSPPSSPFYHELDQATLNITTEQDPTFETSAADPADASAKIRG